MAVKSEKMKQNIEYWQLKRCDNPWKPNALINGQSEVYRRMLGILNRLTKQSLAVLVQQSLEMPISDPEHLPSILSLILLKAQDEPLFTSVYAEFCYELAKKMNIGDNISSACKSHFIESHQRLIHFNENANEPLSMEVIHREILARKRLTVHISFTCELERKTLVPVDHLVSMADVLFRHDDLRSLECLCRLFSFAGERITREAPDLMDRCFLELQNRMNSPVVPPRLKFLLTNTMELRNNDWRPQPPRNSEFGGRNVRG